MVIRIRNENGWKAGQSLFPCKFLLSSHLVFLLLLSTGKDMIEKLQYRFQRTKMDADAVEDVYDGQLYKQHSCPGGFLSNPHNISFLGNTDGVSLIRSNGYGVWPVYLVINEIPPTQRCVGIFFFCCENLRMSCYYTNDGYSYLS